MQTFDVYGDIAKRTGGDIYIGVVGPVRTGKSTLIRKFMTQLVLPAMPDSPMKDVTKDELPVSSEGKTVTTTEPKFIPGEAVNIKIGETSLNVRMIDCVGFAADGAVGFEEDGKARLVRTPWSETPLPFEQAARLGTQRVIREHSTIGIMVTSDGSFTGIDRTSYERAEEEAVKELKEMGKPFVIILNSSQPSESMRSAMQEKYNAPVLAFDVTKLDTDDIRVILETVLFEFPLLSTDVVLPSWMQVLPLASKTVSEVTSAVMETMKSVEKLKDCAKLETVFSDKAKWKGTTLSLYPAEGRAECRAEAQDGVFFGVLSDECGEEIKDESALMDYVKTLSEKKKVFDVIGFALEEAEEKGYGVVYPDLASVRLTEPRLVKSGAHYGTKLRASASGYHIVKVDVTGEIEQILGSEEQGEKFVEQLRSAYEADERSVLDVDVFGRPIRSLVEEKLDSKMSGMSAEQKRKIKRTVSRIVNEGKNNVICFVF
ncbi:MAG: stage IV sporulation protein A [Clostridia bacterium]|nr:stage IV sporulation protein A [Clostridia bacterium]